MNSFLKIGIIQPSGHYTSYTKGIELSNSFGPLLGRPVELITRDNQPSGKSFPSPEATITAAKILIEIEEVVAILGPIYSVNARFLASAIEIPILTAAQDPGIMNGEFIFSVAPSKSSHNGEHNTIFNTQDQHSPPSTQIFIESYIKKYGTNPDSVAASGYDGMRILSMGIERAGSTDPVAVRDSIMETKDYAGARLIARYDSNRIPVMMED